MGRARDWLSKLVDMDHPAVTPRSDVVMRGLLFFEEYPYRFLVTIATFCLLLLLRYTVALHPYSGKGKPPMYGDFEAQRHWLEVTTALPIGEWYTNTSRNDLQYWGLDYPPLTAYVSWGYGKLAQVIYPPMVELGTSRGIETPECILFMRLSVLLLDFLLYFPAVWMFVGRVGRHFTDTGPRGQDVTARKEHLWAHQQYFTLIILLQPGLALIDHGHFQYNSTALGLVAWTIVALDSGRDVLASVLYCLALNFKQMTLYYAPAFFFYILSRCIWPSGRAFKFSEFLKRLVPIGFAVIATFAVHWLPFCLYSMPGVTCTGGMLQVLHRLFPFSRGLFESKVSNLWHAIDVVFKIRQWAPREILVKLSTSITALLFAPSCVGVMVKGSHNTQRLLFALAATSMSFFLASFQVHEKSILLPLLPMSLLAAADTKLVACGFGAIATFSMFPLFRLDGIIGPYVLGAAGIAFLTFAPETLFMTGTPLERVAVVSSCAGAGLLHVALFFAPPSLTARYPDIEAVLISLYSCSIFVATWAYASWKVWTVRDVDTPQFSDSSDSDGEGKKVR